MAEVTYNINGVITSSNFIGNSIELLPKTDLTVSADSKSDKVRIYVKTNNIVIRQAVRNIESTTTSNAVSIEPLLDALTPEEYRLKLEIEPRLVRYEFIRPLESTNTFLYKISPDRTEVKVRSLTGDTSTLYTELQSRFNSTTYLPYIVIRTGSNYAEITNVGIQDNDLILKLSNPLTGAFSVNTEITLEEFIADPVEYSITSTTTVEPVKLEFLRGPNFNIELDDQSNVSTEYLDYNNLYSYPVTASYNRLLAEISGSGVDINVDYTSFENFVHFSSAKERLANFKYKVGLIELYEQEKVTGSSYTNAATAVTSSNVYYDKLIKGIISKFDGYERYLYFESGSKTWPKTTSATPYLNAGTGSIAATSWYASEYASASLYDELNESNLEYTIPEFIRQNPDNAPYSLFVNMIGQHFDDLWLYAQDITNKYNGDNRLNYGVSKDLITKTLQNFGVKLYSSNFSVSNLASLFLGEWYNSDSEQITTFVTASNVPTPDKEVLQETYKRIYHNLPYLIKTKGTERGLRALINCFGLPSSSLQIKEFGGVVSSNMPVYTVLRDDRYVDDYIKTPVTNSSTPYFGNELEVSSSIRDKVRIENTGSVIAGFTLSQFTSIVKPVNDYTQDVHQLEVGFSPSYYINDHILRNITASFNIDDHIGDPRTARYRRYTSLEPHISASMSDLDMYNVYDFVRVIKFFDNQLIKMIKDFTPARSQTSTGIIIKPHLLNRNKVPQPIFSDTPEARPEYTASIDTAFATASDGGVVGLLSTAYTASVLTPSGALLSIRNTETEKYTGELSGSYMKVTNGELNIDNPFKEPLQPACTYTVTQYLDGDGIDDANFLYGYPISSGNILIYWGTGFPNNSNYVKYIKFHFSPDTGDVNFNTTFRSGITTVKIGSNTYYPSDIRIGTTAAILTFAEPRDAEISLNPGAFPVTTTENVVVTPYVITRFDNSDYNALFNNADAVANSARVQKVDYSIGALTPLNLEALRNGIADEANLQEYVYESFAFNSSRYKGRQLNGAKFNEYTEGDKSYGTTAVAENKSTYFSYFNEITDIGPELNGNVNVDIRYLVDDTGTYLDILPDSEEFKILQQVYREGGISKITLDSGNYSGVYMGSLSGTHIVKKVGQRVEPVVYSHSSSIGYNHTASIDFGSDSTINDYRGIHLMTVPQSPIYSKDDNSYIVKFDATIDQGSGGSYSAVSGEYTIEVASSFDLTFEVKIVVDSEKNFLWFNQADYLEIKVEYYNGTTWNQLRHYQVEIVGDVQITNTSPYRYKMKRESADNSITVLAQPKLRSNGTRVDLNKGDKVRVRIYSDDGDFEIKGDSHLTILQAVSPAAKWEKGTSYWIAGSHPLISFVVGGTVVSGSSYLFSSAANIGQVYGLTQTSSGSVNNTYSIPPQPFIVKPGDQIRFGNDEKEVYNIINVKEPGTTATYNLTGGGTYTNSIGLVLTVDPPLRSALTGSADINSFLIRTWVDDPKNIIVAGTKPSGSTSGGVITPEYMTKTTQSTLKRVLPNLRSELRSQTN